MAPGDGEGLPAEDFKRQLFLQLESSGVVNSLKSQLRTQMLSQLQSKYSAGVSPPDTETPSLARRAVNSLIADYLSFSKYHYSLSVFQPESGLTASSSAPLSAEEILQVMHLSRSTPLYQALDRRGAAPAPPQLTHPDSITTSGQKDSCLIMEIFESIQEVNDRVLNEASTQTYEEGGFRLGTQLQLLEDRFSAQSKAAASNPFRTLEDRMANYRREVDERAKQEVSQQVERVRELEVSAVRLEEATKYRRALEQERQELERVYVDRNAKLREREEAQSERLRRQQRDVEGAAFEHRQRIVREEDRLRAWRSEVQMEVDQKTEAQQQRTAQVEAREATVSAREAEAERRHVEATQMVALAEERAGRKAKEELHLRLEELQRDRLAVESERARLMELRTEAMTELTAARATQEKLRAMTALKDEADLRAKASEAAEEASRLKLERALAELEDMARQAKRSGGHLSGVDPDASFLSAASFGHMLNATQGAPSLTETAALKDALKRSEQARKRFQREARALREQVQVLQDRESPLGLAMQRSQQLLDEGLESQEGALAAMEDMELSFSALCRQVEDLQASNSRLRRDLLQHLAASNTGREPPATSAEAAAAPPTHELSELKHQVHSLRRDLDQYRRKVEDQRWRATREQLDVTKSGRKPRAWPVDFRRDKENYDSGYEDTDTGPVHQASGDMQREALVQAWQPMQGSPGFAGTPHWGTQSLSLPGSAPSGHQLLQPVPITPQPLPTGYVQAVVNGQQVLVPAGSLQSSAHDALRPPATAAPSATPASPLRDFIRDQSITPPSAVGTMQLQQTPSTAPVRAEDFDSSDVRTVSALGSLTIGAEATATDTRAALAQQEEAERLRTLQAERDVADDLERQQQQMLQAKRRQQEEERLRLEAQRAREDEEALALRIKQQKEAEAEQLRKAQQRDEEIKESRASTVEAPSQGKVRELNKAADDFLAAAEAADAEEERRVAEQAAARRAAMEERRRAAEEERQRAAEEEQAEAERRAKEAEDQREAERRAEEAEAEAKTAAEENREAEEEVEEEEAAREEQERAARLEEYRRQKEEQRRREEAELIQAMNEADDISVPSQSGSDLVDGDFDIDSLLDSGSLPPDLDDIGDF